MSLEGHQWNIPVESYLFTFMSMFSICSFPGIRRGSCRLKNRTDSCSVSTVYGGISFPLRKVILIFTSVKLATAMLLYHSLLVWLWRHLNTKARLLTAVQRRTARLEHYWLNGMTTQGQLPAFTLSFSSWRYVEQILKAPTGSYFKYFRNLPNHILLSQLMVINISAACHNQTG